jgi:hypothetical protein
MGTVSERYSPVVVATNATVSSNNVASLGGFLCTASGALTLSSNGEGNLANGQTLFTSFAVTAGIYYPMPFRVNGGYTLVASSGAAGVLGVV